MPSLRTEPATFIVHPLCGQARHENYVRFRLPGRGFAHVEAFHPLDLVQGNDIVALGGSSVFGETAKDHHSVTQGHDQIGSADVQRLAAHQVQPHGLKKLRVKILLKMLMAHRSPQDLIYRFVTFA